MDRQRLTSASVTVGDVSGSTVVTGADDSVVLDEDATDSSFHAIAPLRSQRCQLHEVLIPAWAQPLRIQKIQVPKGAMQALDGIGAIEQPHLCSVN